MEDTVSDSIILYFGIHMRRIGSVFNVTSTVIILAVGMVTRCIVYSEVLHKCSLCL